MDNNNFFLKLIGKLDEKETKKDVNKVLDNISNSFKKINLKAELEKTSIDEINKQLKSLKMTISKQSVVDIKSQIENALNGIKVNVRPTTNSPANYSKSNNTNQVANRNILDSYSSNSIVRKKTYKSPKFDNNLYAAKEAQEYFSKLLKDENALISVTEKFNEVNKTTLESFVVNIKRANGEVESLEYQLEKFGKKKDNNFRFANVSSKVNDSGAIKQIQQIENAVSKYQAKLAEFKNVNANITSGLSEPIRNFEESLTNLKNGKITIDEMKRSFDNLTASASKIRGGLPKQLDSVASAIKEIQNGKSTISNLTNDFNKLGVQSDKVSNSISNATTALSQIKEIENAEGRTDNWSNKYAEYKRHIQEAREEINRLNKEQISTNKIENAVSKFEKYNSQITRLSNQLSSLSVTSDSATNEIEELKKAYNELVNSPKDSRINNEKLFQNQLAKTTGIVQNLKATYASINAKSKLLTNIKTYLDINTAASKDAKRELNEYVSIIENSDDLTLSSLNNIDSAFQRIKISEREAGNLGKNLFDALTEGAKKFVTWGIATRGTMIAWNKMRDVARSVYDIDSAMTDLYKVTDATESQYTNFLINASKDAKNLGRDISSLVEQTASWGKSGYNLFESAELAKSSSIYSNVGDVDDATAVKNIVSSLKGFNKTASESIQVVDSLNALSNNFAVTAGGLGDGLARSASSMSLANTSMEKTLAILTGASEITQETEEMGNALKVGAMRIRGKIHATI